MVSLLHKQQKHRLVSMFNCLRNRDEDEKENTQPFFLYATKEELIKENLHFALSSPETTTHLRKYNRKKNSSERNEVPFLKQVFPK